MYACMYIYIYIYIHTHKSVSPRLHHPARGPRPAAQVQVVVGVVQRGLSMLIMLCYIILYYSLVYSSIFSFISYHIILY